MANFCKYCGTSLHEGSKFCDNCGAAIDENKNTNQGSSTTNSEAKSRTVAGLLGIFLGGWGIHNFYLGYNDKGAIQIVVTILTCGVGALWGFIEGILILCGSINTDSNGVALKD